MENKFNIGDNVYYQEIGCIDNYIHSEIISVNLSKSGIRYEILGCSFRLSEEEICCKDDLQLLIKKNATKRILGELKNIEKQIGIKEAFDIIYDILDIKINYKKNIILAIILWSIMIMSICLNIYLLTG